MLKSGLYEQVINKEIDAELSVLKDKFSQTASIDKAEGSKILAKYIAEIIEKGLDNVRDNGGDVVAQVDLANKIVTTIIDQTKEADFDVFKISERAQQLLALMDKNDSALLLNEKVQVTRPETSISQSSLFTGAIHEPQMFTELKKKLCHQIVLICWYPLSSGADCG